MRTTQLVLFAVVFMFNLGFLMAQTESGNLMKPFGLGLHIEQYKATDIEDLNTAPANKIAITINPAKFIRVEPEFGFKIGSNKSGGLKKAVFFWEQEFLE